MTTMSETTKDREALLSAPAQPQYIIADPSSVMTQRDTQSLKRWYVCGILSTIFCCLPCGIIGLVHAMIAKHEGERGNDPAYRRRMRQTKCWTSWSVALGLLVLSLYIAWVVVVNVFTGRAMNRYVDDEVFPQTTDDRSAHKEDVVIHSSRRPTTRRSPFFDFFPTTKLAWTGDSPGYDFTGKQTPQWKEWESEKSSSASPENRDATTKPWTWVQANEKTRKGGMATTKSWRSTDEIYMDTALDEVTPKSWLYEVDEVDEVDEMSGDDDEVDGMSGDDDEDIWEASVKASWNEKGSQMWIDKNFETTTTSFFKKWIWYRTTLRLDASVPTTKIPQTSSENGKTDKGLFSQFDMYKRT